jgi:hypothetical protein
MKRSPEFMDCDSLSGLALKLVETRQYLVFPLVYRSTALVHLHWHYPWQQHQWTRFLGHEYYNDRSLKQDRWWLPQWFDGLLCWVRAICKNWWQEDYAKFSFLTSTIFILLGWIQLNCITIPFYQNVELYYTCAKIWTHNFIRLRSYGDTQLRNLTTQVLGVRVSSF